MNLIRYLVFTALVLFASGAADAGEGLRFDPAGADLRFQFPDGLYGAAAAPAAFYSFSDVYRLTVAGPQAALDATGEAAFADIPMRVVAAETPVAAYAFSITAVRQPERWLLVLAGLAAAAWVARRRLVQAI